MKRSRSESFFYAVKPFLIYMILFTAIRSAPGMLAESALTAAPDDLVLLYTEWKDAVDLLTLSVSAVCAVIPVIREGRRDILIFRHRQDRSWITGRRDSNMLIALLMIGTVSLCALINILMIGSTGSEIPMNPACVPLAAAVYGLLTPFTEEVVCRGVMWYRLRCGFASLWAAVISSALFGASHGNWRQGIYGFVMGMVFSLAYELTRQFEVPFLLHCTCNLLVLAAVTFGWTDVLKSPQWILFFAAAAAVCFAYWAKRLKETDFRFL